PAPAPLPPRLPTREAVAATPPAAPGDTRPWNLWELERLARERAGADPERDEEWAFLLVYLREFAGPDGALPVDFDALVRDSFPELVEGAPR
ncbi:MAG: hypothetical protein ABR521_08265, partial [Gaiellaceae bacterium]